MQVTLQQGKEKPPEMHRAVRRLSNTQINECCHLKKSLFNFSSFFFLLPPPPPNTLTGVSFTILGFCHIIFSTSQKFAGSSKHKQEASSVVSLCLSKRYMWEQLVWAVAVQGHRVYCVGCSHDHGVKQQKALSLQP